MITHIEYDQRRYSTVFTVRFSCKRESEDANNLLGIDIRPPELAQSDSVYFLRMAGREEESKHRVVCLVLKMVDRAMTMYERVGLHAWDADVVNALGIFENINKSVITLI
jgi:predicted GNAT superfamily acetyltransferase